MSPFLNASAGHVALDQILASDRPQSLAVAFNGHSFIPWSELSSRVSGLIHRLREEKKGRWLVSSESSFSFATSLLALWATEQIAVLPPNHQPGSLRESAQGVVGLLSDSDQTDLSLPHLSPLLFEGPKVAGAPFRSTVPSLELFTSGTTGERRAVIKNLTQIGEEIKTLEKVFGERLGGSVIFSTVSHQHIYGLLFRVLWPLCAGRPFHIKTPLFWEDLFAEWPPSLDATLVSSPTHLERIPSLPLGHRIKGIFSSGGKLKELVALRVGDLLGQTPIEVFGSTETGGVGWRQQSRDPDSLLWRPLPGVHVSGGCPLAVHSPFTGLPEASHAEEKGRSETTGLGDFGTVFPDGRFRVEGRIDRIVKVAEKRLSLDDMEQRLGRHVFVNKSTALLLDSTEDNGRRSIGIVVQLSDSGKKTLTDCGKEFIFQEFRKHLLMDFDATLVPRRFRLVEKFPEDSQGKVPLDRLLLLFRPSFDENVTHPHLVQKEISEGSVFLKALVPETLSYFDGHFQFYPIVPGIVQLKWVMDAIEEWKGSEPHLQRFEAIKFKRTLRPAQTFTLRMNDTSTRSEKSVVFTYQDENNLVSSGKVFFE